MGTTIIMVLIFTTYHETILCLSRSRSCYGAGVYLVRSSLVSSSYSRSYRPIHPLSQEMTPRHGSWLLSSSSTSFVMLALFFRFSHACDESPQQIYAALDRSILLGTLWCLKQPTLRVKMVECHEVLPGRYWVSLTNSQERAA